MLVFQKSSAYKFVKGSVKDMVNIVFEHLDKMTRGVSPCVDQVPLQNKFLHAAIVRMQYYMRRDTLTSEGLLITLTGKSALESEYNEMETMIEAKNDKITLRNLEVFHRFKWLLSKSQKETVATWVQYVLKNSEAATKFCDVDDVDSDASHDSAHGEDELVEAEAPATPLVEKNEDLQTSDIVDLPDIVAPPPLPPLAAPPPSDLEAKSNDEKTSKATANIKKAPRAHPKGLKHLWAKP